MKRVLFVSLLAIFYSFSSAQNTSVDLTWAYGIGSAVNDNVKASCTDASGNIYITGMVSYSLDFNPSFPTYTLNANTTNAYLAKYDQLGNFVWAKVFDGTATSEGKGVGVDGSGNIYVCVKYSGGDINADPMASNVTYTATGGEMFIEKFTSAGSSVWTYSVGGGFSSFMKPESMAVNTAGDIILVGAFTPSPVVDFNPAGPSLTVTTVGYSYDGFVAKYNSSGVCQWAFNLGDVANDYVYGVKTDASNNVYVTGSFQGNTDFDPSISTSSIVTAAAFADGFIAKYTSAGAFVWAGGIGGSQFDEFASINLDAAGNVLVSGVMQSPTIDADMGTGNWPLNKVGSGNLDLFVGKYLSSNGDIVWANNTGGDDDAVPLSVASDTQNNVYIAGYFKGICDFDMAVAVNNMTVVTTNGADAYIAKYTPGGAYIYAKQIGGGTSVGNQVSKIEIDNANNILITGMQSYSVDVDFNSTNTLPHYGGSDIFFIKYSQCIDAGTPTIALTTQTMCANSIATLSISGGQLNSATNWIWTSMSCISSTIGVGTTCTVNPVFLTQYFVHGEGGCTTPGPCASATVDVAPLKGITGTVTTNPGPVPVPGIVQLFRYEGPLTKWDSVTYQNINASGIYSFNAVNSGSYIIMAVPTATDLVRSYAPNNATWKGATIFPHGCVTDFNINIDVVPMLTLTPGPGVLSGKIVEGVNYGGKGLSVAPGNPIGGISVKGGKNPGGGISAQGKTDAAGGFTFTNLPLSAPGESYFIFVDIPGVDTAGTHHKAITTSTTMYTDLDFLVDSDYVRPIDYTGIKELRLAGEKMTVYPNPATDMVYVKLDAKNESNISLELYDMFGKKVLGQNYEAVQSEFKVGINVATLNRGVYFVKVKLNSGEAMIKLVLSE